MREKTCIFTGHRVIPHSKREPLRAALSLQIRTLAEHRVCSFGSGGALGFDQMAAKEVLALQKELPEVKLALYLPCRDQDRYWTEADRLRYRAICDAANSVTYTSEHYSRQCMHVRNRYMVDQGQICLAFLERDWGGTAYTVRYATGRGLTVINLNDRLELFSHE